MSNRYSVAAGQQFTYPADPISLRLVREAGGVSQMSEEDREKVKFKTVSEGEDCTDMPEPALGIYIARGWVHDTMAVTPVPAVPAVVSEPEPAISEEVWKDLGRPEAVPIADDDVKEGGE